MKETWELVSETRTPETGSIFFEQKLERFKVPGGWLVRYSGYDGVAMTFFPDPGHDWEFYE